MRWGGAQAAMDNSNAILSRLAADDQRLLSQHFEAVELPVRRLLQVRKKLVEYAYFIDSGVASLVASGEHPVEVALIGREGFTGLPVVLGIDERVEFEIHMQIAGAGQRIAVREFKHALSASPTLCTVLLRYAHRFMMQIARTAVANARLTVEERLSRWLLMTQDRLDGDEIALTHDDLATMIGTRRSGISTGLQELERRGWITRRRGVIRILDRKALKENTRGTYSEPPKSER
jgi:CRP-like cAMP-binding protein